MHRNRPAVVAIVVVVVAVACALGWWDGRTRKPRVLVTHRGTGYAFLGPAPDGHRVAFVVGGKDGRFILVYDLSSGALSTIASEKYGAHLIPADPIWDPTGKYLAVSLSGFSGATILPSRVRVYEVQSGRRIRRHTSVAGRRGGALGRRGPARATDDEEVDGRLR
jgi:hypothetical protein